MHVILIHLYVELKNNWSRWQYAKEIKIRVGFSVQEKLH